MGRRIGLDNGTTYSAIAEMEIHEKDTSGRILDYEIEACIPNEQAQSAWIASEVLKNQSGRLLCGTLARDSAGRKGTTTYKGFKMLLGEKDIQVLKNRGYDEIYTPQRIMKEYLTTLLKGYLSRYSTEEKIEKIVIGVPEIWFSDLTTIDSRTLLNDIVSEMPFVDEVELVSEPACATAYFVENYRKLTGNNYEGWILVVDYGGGTLDIALCSVKANGLHSEISVEKRCGAGVNEEGFIGKAGLAFVEKIVKLALTPLGLSDEEINTCSKFPKAMISVETAIINQAHDIAEVMEYAESDTSVLEGELYSFEWEDGEEYLVTYGMLRDAYNEIIAPVLREKLQEMITYMDNNGIKWENPKNDTFKIAMAGGFCNFCLTQKQVKDIMKKCVEDRRFKDVIDNKTEAEFAIAYGAALIANDVIDFRQLSPYHIGLARREPKNASDFFWAIHMGDEIELGEPVYIEDETEEKVVFVGSNIPRFALSYSQDPYNGIACSEPLERYQEALVLGNMCYHIGFSFDRSMVITIHLQQVDANNRQMVGAAKEIRLTNIHSLMGALNAVRRYER